MTVPYGPPQQPPVSYLPGPWVVLVADDLALLVDLPPNSPVLLSCWNAVNQGAGPDGVLAAIVAAGPGAVPDFALAGPAGDGGTRFVVSGRARLEVFVPDGEPVVLTADGPSWREERVHGRPALRLAGATPPADDTTGAALPLVRGIALAASIGLGTSPVTPSTHEPPPPAAAPAAAPPVAPSVAPADPGPVPVPVRVSSDTMPPRSEFDSGLIDSLPWRTPDTFGEDQPAAPSGEPVPPPVAPEAVPTPSWGDPYAPAQDPLAHNPWAGVAPPAWPEPEPAAAPPPAWPVPGTPPGGNWGEPAAPQHGRPDPNSVQDNPWAPGGAAGRDEVAADPVPVPPSDGSSGPVVHAFACPRGHLNPPYAGTCRICDEPIPPQEGFAAPRPSLGVLTLSTGDTVPLDRDVVLGRAPFHADENAASRPHLVQLSSPGNDISRSHVRINLENWFVQVTDLGSTNGTVVTLPDQAPVRLRPHDPFTILPGTTVNIADEVTLRFDAS